MSNSTKNKDNSNESKVPGFDNTKKAILDYLRKPEVVKKLKKELDIKIKKERMDVDKKFFKTNKGKRILKALLSNYKKF
jgi:hypothetical protein|tara:strand:- start:84 stop:320 length:237 start_codon:yes stop_codon:yes gene_type:complete